MITKTVHGVTMSPRMSRVWTFIREERGIPLTDWSTDECVEREQAALRDGEKILVARCAKAPADRQLADLLTDYRAIMARRPHGRVTEASLREGEAKALVARRDMNEGLGEDDIARKMRGGW